MFPDTGVELLVKCVLYDQLQCPAIPHLVFPASATSCLWLLYDWLDRLR